MFCRLGICSFSGPSGLGVCFAKGIGVVSFCVMIEDGYFELAWYFIFPVYYNFRLAKDLAYSPV